MKNKLIFKLILILTTAVYANAQQITGKVTDVDGEPIPGANIVEKGTTNGTITNLDGEYIITNISEDATLQFSFIGYLTEEVKVNDKKVIDVQLIQNIEEFDEVVVIGYGTQNKKDLSSAITVVEPEELQRNPGVSLEQSLQGQAAGVMVSSYGGSPGANAKVHIRGIGSPNNTDPLYVIDGVPGASPRSISPSDIENIQILKDGASTAIYGARGANGVIIINTKSGKAGEIKITFDGYRGVQEVWRTIDMLNAQQYASLIDEAAENASSLFIPVEPPARVQDALENPEKYGEGTDWQDAIFQSAPIQRYDLGISGGSDNLTFSSSIGYFNQEGTIINTEYEQFNVRLKTRLEREKLVMGQSFAGSYSVRNRAVSQGGRSMLQLATTSTPTLPVYDSVGNFQGATTEDGINIWNPVAWSAYNKNQRQAMNVMGNLFAEYELIKDLKLKYNFGITGGGDRDLRVEDTYDIGDFFENSAKDLSESYNVNFRFINELTLTYKKVFGRHAFTALAGYTREKRKKTEMGVRVEGFPADFMESVGTGELLQSKWGTPSESRIESALARLQYNYASRYYVTANFRRDGNSVFDQEYLYGNFPSVSLAWRVSEESFFGADMINNMKLRMSFGEVGNAPIGNYGFLTRLNSGVNYTFGGDLATGTVQTRYPTVGAKWESTVTQNVGLDVDMYNNKLSLIFDAFIKETRDILLQVPIPYSAANNKVPPDLNAGTVENRGVEVTLSHNNTFGNLEYFFSGNFTYVQNEVIETSANENVIIDGDTELGNVSRMEVGFPIGYFKGYEVEGIYRTQQEIDAVAEVYPDLVENLKPGDIIYRDQNSNGELNAEDMVMIGNPYPDIIYSFNAGLYYNDFDFSFQFQGIQGNEIFSEMIHWTQNMSLTGNQSAATLNRWRPVAEDNNASATLPRAELDRTVNQRLSDRYIEDGSYLRLKNVTLGYTLANQWSERIGIERFRIYFKGQNLLTFTNYSMFDPEIGSGENLNAGIDRGTYPVPRVYLVGVQLDF